MRRTLLCILGLLAPLAAVTPTRAERAEPVPAPEPVPEPAPAVSEGATP